MFGGEGGDSCRDWHHWLGSLSSKVHLPGAAVLTHSDFDFKFAPAEANGYRFVFWYKIISRNQLELSI